jgi:BirA family transcriptional regulator, biotin operon repressor / biotin---[acetyl-CoA-carboxylase] ligase
MKLLHFESIDSTNTYLKTNFATLDHLKVISATRQTSGRGRMDRAWIDDGSQALFSILLKDHLQLTEIALLPFLAAKVVHEHLILSIPRLQIKWPNDLVVEHRKLAGILVETVFEGSHPIAAIIGIGINVNTLEFPFDLKETATSIRLQTNQTQEIQSLIQTLASRFETAWNKIQEPYEIIDYCNRFASLINQPVSFLQNDKGLNGIARTIQPDGSLLIDTETGLLSITSGEVNHVRILPKPRV